MPNFGDALAPLLLKRFANTEVDRSIVGRALIASIGSILEHIPAKWDGHILGSGRLKPNSRLSIASANILALRGPLSANGIKGSIALGDPGTLANELVGPQKKKYDLGILPHWRDKELVPRFMELIPKSANIKIISPGSDPLTVVRQIGSCRRIVTSSLHGMIVADAFGGIPRRVEISPALQNEGGDFKFRDYSASIGTPFEPGKMTEPSRRLVEDVKYSIFDAYQALEKALQES